MMRNATPITAARPTNAPIAATTRVMALFFFGQDELLQRPELPLVLQEKKNFIFSINIENKSKQAEDEDK